MPNARRASSADVSSTCTSKSGGGDFAGAASRRRLRVQSVACTELGVVPLDVSTSGSSPQKNRRISMIRYAKNWALCWSSLFSKVIHCRDSDMEVVPDLIAGDVGIVPVVSEVVILVVFCSRVRSISDTKPQALPATSHWTALVILLALPVPWLHRTWTWYFVHSACKKLEIDLHQPH
jgi:hypothetical protein